MSHGVARCDKANKCQLCSRHQKKNVQWIKVVTNDSIGKCSSELYSFNLLKLPPPPRAAILVYYKFPSWWGIDWSSLNQHLIEFWGLAIHYNKLLLWWKRNDLNGGDPDSMSDASTIKSPGSIFEGWIFTICKTQVVNMSLILQVLQEYRTLNLILDDLILQPRLGDSQPPDNGPQMAQMLAAALDQIKTMEAPIEFCKWDPCFSWIFEEEYPNGCCYSSKCRKCAIPGGW